MSYVDDFIKNHRIQKLETDGVVGEYILGGKGKEGFLIFPGGGQDPISCYDLVDALEGQHKVIAVNFTGFTRLESFFKFINKILEKEGIDKVVVYGLSLGGFFSQHYAIRNPRRISKIILSHTGSTKSPTIRKKVIIPGKILHFLLPIIPLSIFKYLIVKLAPLIQSRTSQIDELYLQYSTQQNLQRRKEFGKRFKLSFLTRQYLESFYKLGIEMEKDEQNWNLKNLNELGKKMLIVKTDNDPLAQDDGIF